MQNDRRVLAWIKELLPQSDASFTRQDMHIILNPQ